MIINGDLVHSPKRISKTVRILTAQQPQKTAETTCITGKRPNIPLVALYDVRATVAKFGLRAVRTEFYT